MTKPSIYVCTPCFGCQVTIPFLVSVLQLQAACIQRGLQLSVDWIGNESLITRARNILCARFLAASSSTHLLWIDADIAFEPESVFRLLDRDVDIAAAPYAKKSYDYAAAAKRVLGTGEPITQAGLDWNVNVLTLSKTVAQDGWIPLLDTATGFMLLKRDLLQRMVQHYKEELSCKNDLPGTSQSIPEYVAIWDTMIDPDSRRFLSEDYAFCRRAQKMDGTEVWVDLAGPPLTHIGNNTFSHGDIRKRFTLVAVT
jgi:hypothetical protein